MQPDAVVVSGGKWKDSQSRSWLKDRCGGAVCGTNPGAAVPPCPAGSSFALYSAPAAQLPQTVLIRKKEYQRKNRITALKLCK